MVRVGPLRHRKKKLLLLLLFTNYVVHTCTFYYPASNKFVAADVN